ncbi:hypothetical protein FRB91_006605 [Serendipita sp. 411]|nr:hypothetical protein FRB91_006605 [Serendipita sp. 411]
MRVVSIFEPASADKLSTILFIAALYVAEPSPPVIVACLSAVAAGLGMTVSLVNRACLSAGYLCCQM